MDQIVDNEFVNMLTDGLGVKQLYQSASGHPIVGQEEGAGLGAFLLFMVFFFVAWELILFTGEQVFIANLFNGYMILSVAEKN